MGLEKLEQRLCLAAVIDLDRTIGDDGQISINSDDVIVIGTDNAQEVRYISSGTLYRYKLNGSQAAPPKSLDAAIAATYLPLTGGKFAAYGWDPPADSDDNLHPFLRRWTPTGDPDPTFGGDGRVDITLEPTDVAVAPDGGFVVFGRPIEADTYALARFSSNGQLLTSFGDKGYVALPEAIYDSTVLLLPDGKLLMQFSTSEEKQWRRFLPDGLVDEAFSENGILPFTQGDYPQPDAFSKGEMDGTGRVYFRYGFSDSDTGVQHDVLMRYTLDGLLDKTYSGDGSVDFGPTARFYDYQIAPDGTATVFVDDVSDSGYMQREVYDPSGNRFDAESDTLLPSAGVYETPEGETWLYRSDGKLFHLAERPAEQLTSNGTLIVTTGAGNDTVTLTSESGQVQVSVKGTLTRYDAERVQRLDIFTGAGNDVVTFSTSLPARINTSTGGDNVVTGNGEDEIISGPGNDTLSSGNGSDSIFTGDGNDQITAGQATALRQINSGTGFDTLSVRGGFNHIWASGHIRILATTLEAELDRDVVTLGNENDHLESDFAVEVSQYGGGSDLIETSDSDDAIYLLSSSDSTVRARGGNDVVQPNGSGKYIIYGGDGADQLEMEYQSKSCTVYGDAGDDFIRGNDQTTEAMIFHGGDGNDILLGGGGNDSLYGEGGKDMLRAGYGNDLISGGGGKDRIFGSYGNDRLYGGANNDQIDGGPGRDVLDGGQGDDKLFGRNGNDYLRGDDGNDQLHGGKGFDVFAAFDAMIDTLDGGLGSDSILSEDLNLDLLVSVELL